MDELRNLINWPLRGLYWLSKDLFEDKTGFREALEPEAKDLHNIRNHLVHKYLKIHEDDWRGQSNKDPDESYGLADNLSFSIYRNDFENKTLKLLKMVRASLIYLSLAINIEEKNRAQKRASGKKENLPIEIPMDIWEDEWKT